MAATAKVIQSFEVKCADPKCATSAIVDACECGCKRVTIINQGEKPHTCVAQFSAYAQSVKGCKVADHWSQQGMVKTAAKWVGKTVVRKVILGSIGALIGINIG